MALMLTSLSSLHCFAVEGRGRTGKNWYVAPSPLGSDANPRTANRPFATINRAADVAHAGDTVWIKPGTYPPTEMIRLANSGMSDAPIAFRGEAGGPVTIDAQGKIPTYDWNGVFTLDKKAWVVVDGIRVINLHLIYGPSLFSGTHVLVDDPLFVNAKQNNFHLKSSSPAIGMARSEPKSLFDHDGRPRHIPGGHGRMAADLGAFEAH